MKREILLSNLFCLLEVILTFKQINKTCPSHGIGSPKKIITFEWRYFIFPNTIFAARLFKKRMQLYVHVYIYYHKTKKLYRHFKPLLRRCKILREFSKELIVFLLRIRDRVNGSLQRDEMYFV